MLAQQQDPSSANYHRWLTPEQYAASFGLSAADFQQVRNWVEARGFSVADSARSRTWISFNGTAGQVRAAFGTPIHRYLVDGQMHYANSAGPALPSALAGVVGSILGLHDFRLKPHLRQPLEIGLGASCQLRQSRAERRAPPGATIRLRDSVEADSEQDVHVKFG